MKRLRLLIGGLVLLLIAAASLGAFYLNDYLHSPILLTDEETVFEIAAGTSFRRVSEDLAERGIIARPRILRLYARWTGLANSIQAGEYQISPGMTPVKLVEQFSRGYVVLYSFTLVEGWNQWDLLGSLHEHPNLAATMTEEDWPALLDELGAETSHPEGLFLPETYRFPKGTRDRVLLKQAYELMQSTLAEEWANRQESLPVQSPYEALVLASIIEKETARPDERARIAGVFVRRLQKRMRLQTDPTVIYGLEPGFDGNLTRRDLRTDTPYNTYTRHGLPPTPIAAAGRAAIHAALHPAQGEELYFVATGLGDGSHSFSTTKQEHDAAVTEYLKRLRSR